MSNNSPQAQAVTNTLAGERLVTTVAFPTTGDTEMDFIAALVAVWEALPLHPAQALRAVEYFHARVLATAKERETTEQDDLRRRTEDAWLEKKRQELMHRLQGHQGIGQTMPGTGTPWNPSQEVTSSGMPGYLAGGTFAVHKNPDGSETRVPYSEYLANQTPGPGHPPPLYPIPPDGTVPLPHPPEFAEQVRQRGLNARASAEKLVQDLDSRAAKLPWPDKPPAQTPRTKSCPPPKELPPCDPGF